MTFNPTSDSYFSPVLRINPETRERAAQFRHFGFAFEMWPKPFDVQELVRKVRALATAA